MDFCTNYAVPRLNGSAQEYQARAVAQGIDLLGRYTPVWAYAYLQVLGEATEATKNLNDDTLADYIRATTFKRVIGDVKFGNRGEWAKDRMFLVQFQNIKGHSIDEFRNLSTEVILYSPSTGRASSSIPTPEQNELTEQPTRS